MKVASTHFEQVPLEIVKKLADLEIFEKEKTDKGEVDEADVLKREKR
ncbi:MAG TPA: hypothetical protein VGU63_15170 [Candidatus Acidoferrales bacterium]|nr:hypothetical protein [Candidatus Acidoferrales bacterium]